MPKWEKPKNVDRTDYFINKESVGPGAYDSHVRYIPMFQMQQSPAFAPKTKLEKYNRFG